MTRRPTHAPVTDADRALLSALVDGALAPDDEARLLARLDVEPALAAALDDLVMVRGALAAHFDVERAPPVDLTDGVMAAIEGRGALGADPASRGLPEMLAVDLEAAAPPVPDARARDLLATIAATRAHLEQGRALPRDLAPDVAAVVDGDARALAHAALLLDGEGDAATAAELTALLDDEAHGARRRRDVAAFARGAAAVAAHVVHRQDDARAARAGAAALQNLSAATAQTTTTPPAARAGGASRPPLLARLSSLFFPLGLATAAAALFLVIGRPGDLSGGDLVDDREVQVDDVVAVGPLDVLPDNGADVEALETGRASAVVFSTSTSHITVIWVGAPVEPTEQGT